MLLEGSTPALLEISSPPRYSKAVLPPASSNSNGSDSIRDSILIIVVSFALIAGCWNAPFLGYDDRDHVLDNPQVQVPLSFDRLMTITSNYPYYPVTILSYKLDLVMFDSWIGRALGSMAPAFRFETLLIHILSALMLCRLLPYIGLSRMQALFISVVFAAHPMACETVAWIAERKNALAAMFAIAALWSWLRFEGRLWRVPLASLLYFLAVMSKPSALGLLPVFVLLELFGGQKSFTEIDPPLVPPVSKWFGILAGLTPLVLIAFFDLALNIEGHAKVLKELWPPPGGSLFTAALTDLEIVSRYVFNLILPVFISILYYVEPVRHVSDVRVLFYGAILAGLFAVTLYFAENRRRALFGWLWFIAAVGPNLNFIATYDLMQDRYVYLSLPGLFMVIVETAAGIALFSRSVSKAMPRIATVYVAMLLVMAALRSTVWTDTQQLFSDAVEKQPKSSLAHSMLASAYKQAWNGAKKLNRSDIEAEFLRKSNEHLRIAVIDCPDADANPLFAMMAMLVGEEYNRIGNLKAAEKAWMLAAYPPHPYLEKSNVKAIALGYLASLNMAGGHAEKAYTMASEAVATQCEPPSRFSLARASLNYANALKGTDKVRAHWLIEESRSQWGILLFSDKFKLAAQQALADPALYESQ